MRKILITFLLAGAAATPALAGPNDHSDHQQAREERQQAHEERQQARQEARSERAAERPSFTPRSVEAPQARPQFVGNPNGGQFHGDRGGRVEERGDFAGQAGNYVAPGAHMITPGDRGNRGPRVVDLEQRRQDRVDARELRQSSRPLPNVMRDRHPLMVSNTPRPGTQPPLRAESRRTPAIQWSTNWRHNSHYDWHNYRNHHRNHFHLGFYFDPFGWGYQPFQIGWRLWPAYYGSQYWINDPYSYRLPYAPPGYQWIRYYNDALLVDTWTGEVVDVIPNFFW
jgi:Ni/Co efflux regulator RcnB